MAGAFRQTDLSGAAARQRCSRVVQKLILTFQSGKPDSRPLILTSLQ